MGVGRRTVGRVMSRTVLWLMAAGAVVIAAAVGVAWQVQDERAGRPRPGRQARRHRAVAAPSPRRADAAAAAAAGRAGSTAPAPPTVAMPSFDVARIGPDGRAVVAGRAQPGAKIVLLDGGKEIAQRRGRCERRMGRHLPRIRRSASGQHELRVVQHIEGRAPVTSEQVVVAIVPEPPDAARDRRPPARRRRWS